MRAPVFLIAALAVACVLAGCKARPEARYVMRSTDMGVVAMPEDTAANRQRAIALMHSHFPEGYEILWEGEENALGPLPAAVHPHFGHHPLHHRHLHDPVAVAAWNEPGFQQEIESLPGTPQSMEGYAQPPVPSVGMHFGDRPSPPVGVVRREWRITYRRKNGDEQAGDHLVPQSLFPEYHIGAGTTPAGSGEAGDRERRGKARDGRDR